jgi:4-hydroxy-tetrahydrodipicolinate synthase
VVANVEPERTTAMVGAALAGDYETARAIHHELGPLNRALFWETNPIPVKEAMHVRGHHAPELRSPLSRLAPEYRDDLAAVLDDLDDFERAEDDGGDGAADDADDPDEDEDEDRLAEVDS